MNIKIGSLLLEENRAGHGNLDDQGNDGRKPRKDENQHKAGYHDIEKTLLQALLYLRQRHIADMHDRNITHQRRLQVSFYGTYQDGNRKELDNIIVAILQGFVGKIGMRRRKATIDFIYRIFVKPTKHILQLA